MRAAVVAALVVALAVVAQAQLAQLPPFSYEQLQVGAGEHSGSYRPFGFEAEGSDSMVKPPGVDEMAPAAFPFQAPALPADFSQTRFRQAAPANAPYVPQYQPFPQQQPLMQQQQPLMQQQPMQPMQQPVPAAQPAVQQPGLLEVRALPSTAAMPTTPIGAPPRFAEARAQAPAGAGPGMPDDATLADGPDAVKVGSADKLEPLDKDEKDEEMDAQDDADAEKAVDDDLDKDLDMHEHASKHVDADPTESAMDAHDVEAGEKTAPKMDEADEEDVAPKMHADDEDRPRFASKVTPIKGEHEMRFRKKVKRSRNGERITAASHLADTKGRYPKDLKKLKKKAKRQARKARKLAKRAGRGGKGRRSAKRAAKKAAKQANKQAKQVQKQQKKAAKAANGGGAALRGSSGEARRCSDDGKGGCVVRFNPSEIPWTTRTVPAGTFGGSDPVASAQQQTKGLMNLPDMPKLNQIQVAIKKAEFPLSNNPRVAAAEKQFVAQQEELARELAWVGQVKKLIIDYQHRVRAVEGRIRATRGQMAVSRKNIIGMIREERNAKLQAQLNIALSALNKLQSHAGQLNSKISQLRNKKAEFQRTIAAIRRVMGMPVNAQQTAALDQRTVVKSPIVATPRFREAMTVNNDAQNLMSGMLDALNQHERTLTQKQEQLRGPNTAAADVMLEQKERVRVHPQIVRANDVKGTVQRIREQQKANEEVNMGRVEQLLKEYQ